MYCDRAITISLSFGEIQKCVLAAPPQPYSPFGALEQEKAPCALRFTYPRFLNKLIYSVKHPNT